MSTMLRHLTSPGRIGRMELRNRMAVTAMGVGFSNLDGTVSERQIAYHAEQAKGGVGLVITGVTGVSWPAGGVFRGQMGLSEDRFIPGLSRLTDAVHAQGAKIAFQLHRGGPQAVLDMYEGRPLFVPSMPVPEPTAPAPFVVEELAAMAAFGAPQVSFHEMTLEDIQLVVRQFADGARRAREAGADGVEIHVAHGYVIGAFLSAASNRRTDAYGGGLENRARFGLEVVGAVRAAVGADYPVWVKLDSREVERPGGIGIEDAVATAKLFEAAGVDAVTVSAYHGGANNRLHTASHTPHEPGLNLPFAAKIKAAMGVPVIASGRVEPEVADRAIAEGRLDFLSMGRKLLADPHLPRKVSEGRLQDIRPCIYCYTCISAIYVQQPMRCAVRPETGFDEAPQPMAASPPRRVVVIGGGPAGMEAAHRLDALGHRVTLLERDGRLGGTLRIAALGYEANERLLDWLIRKVEASRVEVRLNCEATPDLVRSLAPDHVVVAVGAVRARPDIPGADGKHVFDGDELRSLMLGEASEALKAKTGALTRLVTRVSAATGLSGNLDVVRQATRAWMPLGQEIVIIGGGLVGLELAEFLNARGRKVTVVDEVALLGSGLALLRRARLLEELAEHGVSLQAGASDIAIGPRAVSFRDAAGAPREAPADHVVIAQGAQANLALAERLQAEGFDVHVGGDCAGVGFIEGAMRGAAAVVAKISQTQASA